MHVNPPPPPLLFVGRSEQPDSANLFEKKTIMIYHLLRIICMLSNREEKYSASHKRKLTHNSEICLTVKFF